MIFDKIFQSATKIVLLLMTVALIILTFLRIIDAKDFMTVMIAIIAFYFGQKTNTATIEQQLP
jgi:hypothetical protein